MRRLGDALKQLRKRNGWTLADVSQKSGLSISALSKVQNGQMSLTYDKLVSLSRGLGVDVTYFFAPEPAGQPRAGGGSGTVVMGRRSIHRQGDGIHVSTPVYDHVYPAAELSRKMMAPIYAEPKARTLEEFGPLMRHPGEEYTIVLDGRVEVQTEFYAPVILERGEGIYIDSMMGHAYLAASDDYCRVLSVCTASDVEVEAALTGHGDDHEG
ncbi:XRE family transcriptional regulator [Brevundimonas sp.]|uniref:helix-turn-helix domain-containing protein n=1 Tax=Brevundimonas sp. TaxID=1871086 RepID=UPI001AC7D4DF|nr:XRE family transcriptional regulator [Brevundimonas sp.]MBN9464016.1 helix-turn-helix transcriptional regulator [Brevundimonas sp.]